MPRLYRKSRKVGLPPGTLAAVEGAAQTTLRVMDYDPQGVREKDLSSIEEAFPYRSTPAVSWINIDGRDVNVIKKIDTAFGIHPLVLEDIVNTGQRPKVEDYGEYLFFVLRMISWDEKTAEITSEQVSLILGKNFVLSFQERSGDVFDPVRQRIRDGRGRIRQAGPDYLAYALLDAIVDHYFVVLERIGEKIDKLENDLLRSPSPNMPNRIYQLKTEVIFLRKQIWPLREVLAGFQRMASPLVEAATDVYLRDVYDHTIQVNDTLEAFRESVSSLHDIYLSSVSNRMNEIMKVLTIFAAIFIPLTFIAGIYGMNFEYMPELKWRYGYFLALAVMAGTGTGLLVYFRRKGWM